MYDCFLKWKWITVVHESDERPLFGREAEIGSSPIEEDRPFLKWQRMLAIHR